MDYLDGLYADECQPTRIDRYNEGLMNCHECDKKDCEYYYDYHKRQINPDISEFVSKLNESLGRK